MPQKYGQQGQLVDDPLHDLHQQLLAMQGGAAQPEQAPAQPPVDEQDLSDKSRTFYDPNFINESRMLDANKGQGEKMANELAASARKTGGAASTAIAGAVTTFANGVNSDQPNAGLTTGANAGVSTTGRSGGDLTGGGSPYSYARPGMPTGPVASRPAAPAPAPAAAAPTAPETPTSGRGNTGQALGGAPQRPAAPAAPAPAPAPAPAAAPVPAPAAHPTPAQVGAAGTPASPPGSYAGSKSLLEARPDLAQMAEDAALQANNLGDDVSRRDSVNQLYGKNTGYYGSDSRGWDSVLAGAQGHDVLDQTQKEFGGLEDVLKGANAKSEQQVAARGVRDATAAKVGASRHDAVNADIAQFQKTQAEKAQYAKDREGKESWDKYMGTGGLLEGHKLEHTIQDVGKFLNPVYGIADAAGLPSIEDARTPGYDAQVNGATGMNLNSEAVQFDRAMPGVSDADQRAVYEDLTTAELRALEKMTKPQQHDFLMARYMKLKPALDKAHQDGAAADEAARTQDALNNPPHQVYDGKR